MAYSADLAARIQAALAGTPGLVEKKMFGGVAYMVNGNMACGVVGDELLIRLEADQYDQALASPHTRPFAMGNNQPMKGWLLVAPQACASAADLQQWLLQGVAFAQSLPAK